MASLNCILGQVWVWQVVIVSTGSTARVGPQTPTRTLRKAYCTVPTVSGLSGRAVVSALPVWSRSVSENVGGGTSRDPSRMVILRWK